MLQGLIPKVCMSLASHEEYILPRWSQPHYCGVKNRWLLWLFISHTPPGRCCSQPCFPILLDICFETVGKHFTLNILLFRKLHFSTENLLVYYCLRIFSANSLNPFWFLINNSGLPKSLNFLVWPVTKDCCEA